MRPQNARAIPANPVPAGGWDTRGRAAGGSGWPSGGVSKLCARAGGWTPPAPRLGGAPRPWPGLAQAPPGGGWVRASVQRGRGRAKQHGATQRGGHIAGSPSSPARPPTPRSAGARKAGSRNRAWCRQGGGVARRGVGAGGGGTLAAHSQLAGENRPLAAGACRRCPRRPQGATGGCFLQGGEGGVARRGGSPGARRV